MYHIGYYSFAVRTKSDATNDVLRASVLNKDPEHHVFDCISIVPAFRLFG